VSEVARKSREGLKKMGIVKVLGVQKNPGKLCGGKGSEGGRHIRDSNAREALKRGGSLYRRKNKMGSPYA